MSDDMLGGWVDLMTDDMHRDARDRNVSGAIRELQMGIGMQCSAIRTPDGPDRVARETIEMAIKLLAGVPIRQRHKPKRGRRRR